MAAHRAVLVEADGGSRGNPGPAAYGAVLLDADTREVIAERAECLGTATNNVAEYSGLIAGLELFHEHTPEAELEVRMDSKLVVEQMSGRWRIKHPDMRPLAMRAKQLAPPGTTYTWIPREQNKHADRILNEALDAQAGRASRPAPPRRRAPSPRRRRTARPPGRAAGPGPAPRPRWCWSGTGSRRTRSTSASPAAWAAATPACPRRAGRRSGRPPTGCPRWPRRSTWWSPRRCAAPTSPRRSSGPGWAGRWSPRTASPRWSSAPGTG